MRDIKIDLIEKYGNDKPIKIGYLNLTMEALVKVAVNAVPTEVLLKAIKEQLLFNATRKDLNDEQKLFHEKELKHYLNMIKD